jgi:hypothetical protein
MSAPKKSSVLNPCLLAVRRMNLDRFRVGDSRKWKVLARNLSHLLEYLASFANGDGTFTRNGINYSPSQESMMKKFGLSDTWVEALLKHLRDLGYLSWTRENKHDRCLYTINMPKVSDANYSDDSDPKNSEKKGVLTPTIQKSDPNYSEKNAVLTPTIQNSDANYSREYLAYPSLPCKEPSKKEEPREREPSIPSPPAAGAEMHLSLSEPDTPKATQVVNPEDVDVIAADYARRMNERGNKATGWGKPVNRADIEALLRRFRRWEILQALEYVFDRAAEKDLPYIEKTFFANGGCAGIVALQRQERWKENIQEYINAVNLDDLPGDDLDKFEKDHPPPAGIEGDYALRRAAWNNWNRLDAAKHPACGGCDKRSVALVDGGCENCR